MVQNDKCRKGLKGMAALENSGRRTKEGLKGHVLRLRHLGEDGGDFIHLTGRSETSAKLMVVNGLGYKMLSLKVLLFKIPRFWCKAV